MRVNERNAVLRFREDEGAVMELGVGYNGNCWEGFDESLRESLKTLMTISRGKLSQRTEDD
jgi:hypothetical protein